MFVLRGQVGKGGEVEAILTQLPPFYLPHPCGSTEVQYLSMHVELMTHRQRSRIKIEHVSFWARKDSVIDLSSFGISTQGVKRIHTTDSR